MDSSGRRCAGRALFWAAGAAGILHAAFSLYWALGGRWLLGTVGAWAIEWAQTAPVGTALALGAIAAVKVAAAVIPILVDHDRLPARRWWRLLSWVGGVGLIVYGGVNAAAAAGVLAGVIAAPDGYDRDAMLGHAFLWDPLFFVWGVLLTTALALTTPSRGRGTAPVSSRRTR